MNAPKPSCLFDDDLLRKRNKAELANKLESYFPCSSTSTSDTSYVLDGGYLIHTVNWPLRPATYKEACNAYVSYIQRKFGEFGIKHGPTLVPITTELAPAPETLLNLFSCGCKKGCEHWCECRKAGLMSSAMCRQCVRQSCENSPDIIHDDVVI